MNKRNLVVLGLTLLLSACGFQLRGTGDVEFGLKEIDLQARNSYGETVQQLESLLQSNGVRVTPARSTASTAREQTRQRTASYTSSARSAEYELTSTLDYEFRGPQNLLLLEDSIEVQKVYVHDSNNLIGSSQEGDQLRRNAPRTAAAARPAYPAHHAVTARPPAAGSRNQGTRRGGGRQPPAAPRTRNRSSRPSSYPSAEPARGP